jgi:tellurite resistance-related uncharacterized protein
MNLNEIFQVIDSGFAMNWLDASLVHGQLDVAHQLRQAVREASPEFLNELNQCLQNPDSWSHIELENSDKPPTLKIHYIREENDSNSGEGVILDGF